MAAIIKNGEVPLTATQIKAANALLNKLSNNQTAWLAGYLSGLISQEREPAAPKPGSGGKKLTVLYGSQTGNSEELAQATANKAREKGFDATAVCMDDYSQSQLRKEENLFIVVSTHGEGDPPDNAEEFYSLLHSKRAPRLPGLRYTVLALGDTSYEHFCKIGADFDSLLQTLGADRILERVDCDLDYEEPAEQWMESSLSKLGEVVGGSGGIIATSSTQVTTSEVIYDKKNPFRAPIFEMINLNGRGSDKETLHIELSIEGSGLNFEPGDSLGVYPTNDPAVVNAIIGLLGLKGDERIKIGEENLPLSEALGHRLEITVLTRPLIEKYATVAGVNSINGLLNENNKESLKEYLEGRDLRDLFEDHPPENITGQDLVDVLRKLPARLYSIASSLEAHPDEVHLTVAVVRYNTHGKDRGGVCSTYFSDRFEGRSTVPVYVDRNNNFKLPEDTEAPIIMIGPGTGVAPFRAFIEHRVALGAKGRNWLFFGDRYFHTDFLYQVEWLKYFKKGGLTHLDVAFSRDQSHKIYVQHRMLEKSKEFFQWLVDGAYVYVCGDESQMAHEVHSALIEIAAKEGDLNPEESAQYVKKLQKEKRYQRDVY